ncbi:hypothetical protein DAPPUDRAFT_257868 [Daphnia pulex]|uniref:Uncharacterized protein n=1 Tax=Daphnia pulex TaxID=6669 RepID=E9HEC8_DAPPU|nr:hypothetical protein DAPPUDRAFT_257868 [Daphnia pulex]|eukprot:EFX69913.1 hypothetical protein DAPPUDRAFT_257868 [Daphnia pulex]
MMTWVETAVHFVEMSAIVSCTSHLVQKHLRASKPPCEKLTSDVMWKIRVESFLPFHRIDPLVKLRSREKLLKFKTRQQIK